MQSRGPPVAAVSTITPLRTVHNPSVETANATKRAYRNYVVDIGPVAINKCDQTGVGWTT
jgi:hypothetical protein